VKKKAWLCAAKRRHLSLRPEGSTLPRYRGFSVATGHLPPLLRVDDTALAGQGSTAAVWRHPLLRCKQQAAPGALLSAKSSFDVAACHQCV